MILNKQEIQSIDMQFLKDWCTSSDKKNIDSNNEHYKLLTYLSMQYNGISIADVGMRFGSSAYALARNPNNFVYTFEINQSYKPIFDVENIEICYHDCAKDVTPVLYSYIIVLDIDPHNGKQEEIIINELVKSGYEGFVIADDVYCDSYPELRDWWANLPFEKKYNITEYGHFSGTGLLNFSDEDVILE